MQPHLADITAQLDVAVTALTSLTTESGMAAARAAGWGQGDWLDVVTLCQRVVNQVNAVTDTAMARAAAYETVVDEHGELAQVDDGDGHVALDAPDLLAAPLGLSRAGTADRLDRAVRLVVGVCPETGEPTGLTGLRPAMLAGGLDGWRARIITDELTGAPADVAAAVIAALGSEPGTRAPGALRRRVRTVLGRVSPDLLRERAEAARRRCGLRRGVAEPGVDEWIGLFPSEQAATAWAAIDTLARDLVTTHDGLSLETARGQALLDLVTSNATIDLTVQVTVPADVLRAAQPGDGDTPPREADDTSADLVQVCFGRPEPALVPRAWITDIAAKQQGRTTLACHPVTGALLDHRESTGYTPSPALAALVRARDGRCRFPD